MLEYRQHSDECQETDIADSISEFDGEVKSFTAEDAVHKLVLPIQSGEVSESEN